MNNFIYIAKEASSPLRGEVGAHAPGGGDYVTENTSYRKKPFIKATQNNAKRLRKHLTEAEKKLWYFLRKNQLGVKFRRQQPIGKYIVDFICFDKALIIELDGGQHASQESYDSARDEFLIREGYEVLRFWNNEVMENMEGVLQAIFGHIHHPLLASPLKGEELVRGIV